MKKMKKLAFLVAAPALVLMVVLISCSKESSSSTQPLAVYLTDGPGDFDAVNIDIQAIDVKIDTSRGHMYDDHFGDNDADGDDHGQPHDGFGTWVSLNFTPGVYNVLQFRNGLDSLLGTANISGTVRKIRLQLGNNNSVVVAGVSYPLTLQNPTQNYLYVHLNDRHRGRGQNGGVAVWVDFDLGRSIVQINGQYYLRPVLRPFCNNNFGSIEGKVGPAAARAVIKVYNSTDTAVAIPNPNGFFKVRGLNGGVYSVLYDGKLPYGDTTINNVQVTIGRETRLDSVTLR
jgi:hypothetical protein